MIREKTINKIEALSKDSLCWDSSNRDDVYRCLRSHRDCIKALCIYKKNGDKKRCIALEIYADMYCKDVKKHCCKQYTITFDDKKSFTEDEEKVVSDFCKELVYDLKMMYASDDGKELYVYKKECSPITCDHPATMCFHIYVTDETEIDFQIDMHKCAITDFALSNIYGVSNIWDDGHYDSYDYSRALYDCFNDPDINKETLKALMSNYTKLTKDEKKAVSIKKDINTIAGLSDSDYKTCQEAVDDPTGERRFELNLFLHGLLELDGIKYYQKRNCIMAEVKASGYRDICFTFNNVASYTSFKHLVAAAYGDLNKFFELEA